VQMVLALGAKALAGITSAIGGAGAAAGAGGAAATAASYGASFAAGAGGAGVSAATTTAGALMASGYAAKVAGGMNAATSGSKALSMLSFAGNQVAALSQFALSSQQAAATQAEAFGERLASRQEYIQAEERSNAILQEFFDTVAEQEAFAAASGIDVGSASVYEARREAQARADHQRRIARTSAEMNAALRRGRAAMLKRSARTSQMAAGGAFGGGLVNAVVDYKRSR